jgi:hypothetical protein
MTIETVKIRVNPLRLTAYINYDIDDNLTCLAHPTLLIPRNTDTHIGILAELVATSGTPAEN